MVADGGGLGHFATTLYLFSELMRFAFQKLLTEEWGREWRYKFAQFDESPIAAASIGQVHQATLHDGSRVAVKIQFPGIAQSINADIGYLKSLLTMSFILPRGLFLENSLKVLSQELHEECDYLREAHACEHFKWLLRDDSAFAVPLVHRDMTTRRVLTMDLMRGVSLRSLKDASQSLRDHVSSSGCNQFTLMMVALADRQSCRQVVPQGNVSISVYADRS